MTSNIFSRATLQLLTFLSCLVGGEVTVWHFSHDMFAGYYAFVFILLTISKVFNWPRATWFYGDHLDHVRQCYGKAHLSISPAVVEDLRAQPAVKPFFAATIYKENTETLCNEIGDSLPPKILGYGCALAMYLIIANDPGSTLPTKTELILKSNATVIAFSLPLFWDYARVERQRYWNKELRESD